MDAKEVLDALAVESAKRAKRQVAYRNFLIVCISIPFLVAALGLIGAYGHVGPFANKAFDWNGLLASFGAVALLGSYVGASGRQKELTREAAILQDPRSIPFMIEALGAGDPEIASLARAVLTLQLPKLTDEQAAQIAIDWKALFSHFPWGEVGFQLACLEAARRFAGKEEVAFLDDLGAGKLPAGVSKADPRVQNTALGVSADLRMRLARVVIDEKEREAADGKANLGLER